MANALAGDQVAVARGTYTENLEIRTPVKLLGGYDRRNWSRCLDPCRNTCMSVIDGDQSGWAVSVISVTSGTAVVDGFTLTNGQGGLRVESSTVEVVDCRIERNIGGWVGGAEVTGGSVVTITDSVIWGNGGSSVGAAIAALGSELRVERSTVAGNVGDRPGIVASLSPVYVSESILWDHEGPDLEPKGWPAYYVDWSDVQDALCKGVFSVGRGVFSADPLFVGPESGDLRLRARSPCIDAGRPDSPLDPDGSRADVGACPRGRTALISIALDDATIPAGVSYPTAPRPSPSPSPTPTVAPCAPALEFSQVPEFGVSGNLEGRAVCVDPALHRIAVYIRHGGWWTKPWSHLPLTTICPDGTWGTDVSTGAGDPLADRIAAFLLPIGTDAPLLLGAQELPSQLYNESLAHLSVEREPGYRVVRFADRDWQVKSADSPLDPGPCYYSDDERSVWVDDQDRLHMRLDERDGRWYCTEVNTVEPLGYGSYAFRIGSPIDTLDKNVVIGLFTYDHNEPMHHAELDIEFSRWGADEGPNAQYVVQPWWIEGNRHQFDLRLVEKASTHGFEWEEGKAFFQSLPGIVDFPGRSAEELHAWTLEGTAVPQEAEGAARINVWLSNGRPPSDGEPLELIVEGFEYSAQ